MKVCGFTIIKNAVKFDYPVTEAIRSILPLCDKFIVAIGDSNDGTEELIRSIGSPKIEIMHSTWDMNVREGGKVLAIETNKAFDRIPDEFDWCFYIQSDEVVHEKYLPEIKTGMERWKDENEVEGLLFDYKHFYGSYDYVGDSRKWYRREVRIIRNDKSIRSYRDAQGFRKEGSKLKVKPLNAFIYHYGWVKHPKDQQKKQESFHKMWHDESWLRKNVYGRDEFDYEEIDFLAEFKGTHPEVMKERLKKKNWKFDFDPSYSRVGFKDKFLYWLEKRTGWRPGEYRNYRLI